MNSLTQAQEQIKLCQKRVVQLRKIISDNDEGIQKLSTLKRASTESLLEETLMTIKENELIVEEYAGSNLEELDKEELAKREQKEMAYFLNQKLRIKYNKHNTPQEKKEMLSLLCELPDSANIRDEDIKPIAQKSINISLTYLWGIEEVLEKVIKEVDENLFKTINDNNSFLSIFNIRVIYLIVQFNILFENLKEVYKDQNSRFKGFPPFQAWWFDKIWVDHQAYIGLVKWQKYIKTLCITKQQKTTWETVFTKWVNLKTSLNSYGANAYEYNKVFDKLVIKHCNFKEESNSENIAKMKQYLEKIIKTENFDKNPELDVQSDYFRYKKEIRKSKDAKK